MSSYVMVSETNPQPEAMVSRTLINSAWQSEVHSRASESESSRGLSTETLPNNEGQLVKVVLSAPEQASLIPG